MRPQRFSPWRDPVLLMSMILFGLMYVWLSVAVYRGYNSGMLDVGNMAQAIGNTLDGHLLQYTGPRGNTTRLAGHVELIYVLLVPLYALWPDPQMLLSIQALLMVSAAIPVYRIAVRHSNSVWVGRLAVWVYLLYPTGVAAVLNDFHGDTLAMALALWMLDALDAAAWRRFGMFLILVLWCKIYVTAPILLLGLTLLSPTRAPYASVRQSAVWYIGRRPVTRVGVLTCGTALIWALLTLFIIRPLFTSPDTLPIMSEPAGGSYSQVYFGQLKDILIPQELVVRILSLLVVIMPAALTGLRQWRMILPAFAIALPAAASTGAGSAYDFRHHHYAVAVPFLIVAAIHGGVSQRGARTRTSIRAFGLMLGITLLFHIAFNDTPLGVPFWRASPGYGTNSSRYGRIPRDTFKNTWLQEHVPDRQPLLSNFRLAPHLTQRETLYLHEYITDTPQETAERLLLMLYTVDYAVFDSLNDYYNLIDATTFSGGVAADYKAIGTFMSDPNWQLTAFDDGLMLFERTPDISRNLPQTIEPATRPIAPQTPANVTFGNGVTLHGYDADWRDDTLQLRLYWEATRPVSDTRGIPLSTIGSINVPHLPVAILSPPQTWPVGEVQIETLSIPIPTSTVAHGSGVRWRIGWYNMVHPDAAMLGPAALLDDSSVVELGPIARP